MKVVLDLSNYGTKADFKNAIGVVHHNLLKKLI